MKVRKTKLKFDDAIEGSAGSPCPSTMPDKGTPPTTSRHTNTIITHTQSMNTISNTHSDKAAIAPTPNQTKKHQRILVVDDEPHIRQLSAEALALSGYQVVTAEDGAIAWDALQLQSYNLLVTDNNMCRLTGIGLVKKLHAAHMALPVILVTGAPPTEELKMHPWLKIDATLLKPFTVAELVGTVRQVLRATESVPEQVELKPNWQSQPSADNWRL